MSSHQSSDSDIAIHVEGLTKSFGDKVVVRDLSLTVRRGQILDFSGPTGQERRQQFACCVGC